LLLELVEELGVPFDTEEAQRLAGRAEVGDVPADQ
jgi:hypothetical protein